MKRRAGNINNAAAHHLPFTFHLTEDANNFFKPFLPASIQVKKIPLRAGPASMAIQIKSSCGETVPLSTFCPSKICSRPPPKLNTMPPQEMIQATRKKSQTLRIPFPLFLETGNKRVSITGSSANHPCLKMTGISADADYH